MAGHCRVAASTPCLILKFNLIFDFQTLHMFDFWLCAIKLFVDNKKNGLLPPVVAFYIILSKGFQGQTTLSSFFGVGVGG